MIDRLEGNAQIDSGKSERMKIIGTTIVRSVNQFLVGLSLSLEFAKF